jgi:CPA2 family monovalent cation:H+ antiporter-2
METLLLAIFLTLSVATILNIVLKRFGVSHIIGYILTGTAISYIFGFNGLHINSLDFIGEFGIVGTSKNPPQKLISTDPIK